MRRSRVSEAIALARELWSLSKLQTSEKADMEPSKRLPIATSLNPARDNEVAKRQGSDDDKSWQTYYAENMLVPPIWNPWTLYKIYEESDILQACVGAYVDALARQFDFEPDERPGTENPNTNDEKRLRSFFRQVNEKQSFYSLMRVKERDYWACGNAYIEVLEDRKTFLPTLLYNVPPTFMRVTSQENDPVRIMEKMPRDGEMDEVPVYRYFRKFARMLPTEKLEWFKELGDPRVLNKDTGVFLKDADGQYLMEKNLAPEDHKDVRANSIWWFRNSYGGMIYGIPPWVAAMADIRGLYLSRWVNFDTLDHGGIPPWLLLIYGKLAPGTKKYLEAVIKKWRNPRAYSDPGVLEIEPNLLSFNTSGGAKAGAEFVSMRDMRNEDSMFISYAKNCQVNVGAVFRLAGIHYGRPDAQGGTNEAVIEYTEKNVFEPIRTENDECYNVELIQGRFNIYGWQYKTKRPPLTGESFYKALGMAGRTGGPSLNELTRMCNEMFGQNWPERSHWFYKKISAAEAIGMVRSGQVSYDDKGNPVIHPPKQAQEGQGGNGTPAVQEVKAASDIMDKLIPADVINLWQAMENVEKRVREYRPPEDPNSDFDM